MMSKNPKEAVETLRNAFYSAKTRPVDFRIQQLKALRRMYLENQEAISKALYQDLRKCKQEIVLMEIQMLTNDIDNILMNLGSWVKPERPDKSIVNILDDVKIFNEPYGVVLVLGAWNYPFQLTMLPVHGAIAAGNCVLIKPSDVSVASANLLAELVPKYLDPDCYSVYLGGVPATTELLAEKFDYIFYTGSSHVGKIIHQSASKHLTPTTLELGGKSPVFLDKSADLEIAARRILWGKFVNAGQTCVAPDYLLCTREVQDVFLKHARKIIREWFGEDPQKSPDFGRIVNDTHYTRILRLLNSGKVAIGGTYEQKERYIEPTILIDVKVTDPIMQDEIFGPVLPIVNITDVYEVIKMLGSTPEKPLAFYIFSKRKSDINLLLGGVSCGGVAINDTIMHLCVDTLPFGGVGTSGMGTYHGKYSFDTFTHKKSCLVKDFGAIGEKLASSRYPPYTEGKLRFLKFLLQKRGNISFSLLRYLFVFGLGVLLTYGYSFYKN